MYKQNEKGINTYHHKKVNETQRKTGKEEIRDEKLEKTESNE